MIKKYILWDIIAGILIVLESVILSLSMKTIGLVAYILLDALAIVVVMALTSYFANKMQKNANLLTCLGNAVILVGIYILVNIAYAKTPLGIQSMNNLNEISEIEDQKNMQESDEGIEVSFSDGNASSGIINDGFYLVVAIVGGQIAIKRKEKLEKGIKI